MNNKPLNEGTTKRLEKGINKKSGNQDIRPIKPPPILKGQDAIDFLNGMENPESIKAKEYKEMISNYLFLKNKEEIKPVFKDKEELRIFLNKITNKSSDIFGREIVYGRIDNMIEHAIKIGYVKNK